ncbi:MAG: hypothetical protein V1804_04305 [Patescibacteria group bacterium]
MKRIKVLETFLVLIGASVIFGLILEINPFFYLAFVLAAVGLFVKRPALLIAEGWMKLADFLGLLVSRIILAGVFFIFLTPIALLARKIKGNTLCLKNNKSSFFAVCNHQYGKEDLENVW